MASSSSSVSLEVSLGEQEYVEKMVEGLRFLGKVLKDKTRVRLLALGAYRLVTIKKRVTGLCVVREFHIHDLEAIRRVEGALMIKFRKGFDDAFEMSVPWRLPLGADLAKSLWAAWIDSGGSLLVDRQPVVTDNVPFTFVEDPDHLEAALYKRMRDYDRRRHRPSTAQSLARSNPLKLTALSKEDVTAVAYVLRHTSKYTEVVVRSCAEADDLLESARAASVVSVDSGIRKIQSLSPALTSLDLSQNPLGDRGAALLATAIASCSPPLVSLSLGKCLLKPALDVGGFVQLCASLSLNTSLQFLDLSKNSLGQTGICCLSWYLSGATSLRVFNVADNKSSVSPMLAALSQSNSLTWLDISNNTLKDPESDCSIVAEFELERLKMSNMRYATTLSSSSIPGQQLKRALDAKCPHLHASANYLSFEPVDPRSVAPRDTLVADDLPVATPAIFAQAKQLSLRRCATWTLLATTSASSSHLVKLTVRDSRGIKIDSLVDSLPDNLETLDVSGCCGGDAALHALSRFLRGEKSTEGKRGQRLGRLACDGQRRVSLAGLDALADAVESSTSLVDLWPPLDDAKRAIGTEKKENVGGLAAAVKRMRRSVAANNNLDEWRSLCSSDDDLPPEQIPETLAISTQNRSVWEIGDPDWLSEYSLAAPDVPTLPPPPPSYSEDENWSPPPNRAPPTPPVTHIGDGVLGAIQRGASSFRSSLEELPDATSHLVDNMHQTTTNLSSAVDNFLGRRRQLYASDTETDDEEFDEDDDW